MAYGICRKKSQKNGLGKLRIDLSKLKHLKCKMMMMNTSIRNRRIRFPDTRHSLARKAVSLVEVKAICYKIPMTTYIRNIVLLKRIHLWNIQVKKAMVSVPSLHVILTPKHY